jgi:transposase
VALSALLRQLDAMESEVKTLDEAVFRLAEEERYRQMAAAVDAETGVGRMTTMIFLTEMGDPKRFANRRQVAAYFGLVPTSRETGKQEDRKGRITRQGNRRIRWALCQAEWAAIRTDPRERAWHERLVRRNPKRRKIATVAGMRRLGIRLWQRARIAQGGEPRTPPSRPPEGGKRQFALPAKPRKYRRRSPEREERRLAV